LVDDLVMAFCKASLHDEALELLSDSLVAIKEDTFERALKTQVSYLCVYVCLCVYVLACVCVHDCLSVFVSMCECIYVYV